MQKKRRFRIYLQRLSSCEKVESTFDIKGKPSNVPFDPNYHPEIDETPLLNGNDVSKYKMLIGSALWGTVLGRYDIIYATCTLARYNAIPRQGHLNAALKLFGYLKNNPKACTIFDTRDPHIYPNTGEYSIIGLSYIQVPRKNCLQIYLFRK